MTVRQAPSLSHVQVPAVVVMNPFVTTAQVLTMAKEHGATVGDQIAVNFTEHPTAVRLYSASSLESALRRRRIEVIMKSHVQRAVSVIVGTKEPRLEFTGTLLSVDARYVRMCVGVTKYFRYEQTFSHRKSFEVAVNRHKVAFIDGA